MISLFTGEANQANETIKSAAAIILDVIFIVHQGFAGNRKLAIRSKKWKYLNCGDSGGNNYQKQPLLRPYHDASQPTADAQLYNLEVDPAETNNLYLQEPNVAIRMRAKLEEIKSLTGKPLPQK